MASASATTAANGGMDAITLASKRVVYVGGLANSVTPHLLRAALIPFGPLKSIDMPMDYVKGVHRGFGFCEFEYMDDATECIFNMDGADLMGRTISVSLAQANQINLTTSSSSGHSHHNQQAVWSTDEWFQQHVVGAGSDNNNQSSEENKTKQLDQDELKS